MNQNKILKFLAIGAAILGLIFAAVGVITFLLTAMPESNALRFAANEDYPVQAGIYTQYRRTNTHVNNNRMYRLRFEWDGGYGYTNAAFTNSEANAYIGRQVDIRVGDGRAVPLDFTRSAYSIIGFVFLGVFGGTGVIALVVAAILGYVYKKKVEEGM